MRKRLVAAIVFVGLGLVLLWLLRTEGPEAPSGMEQAAASEQPAAGRVLQPQELEDLGVRGTADAGSTPALSQAPSEKDGVLEVEVLAAGAPVSGASVRLYWRGRRDPNLDEVSWRLASTGHTDEQGRVRLASRPGGYLVVVRAEGYAPLLRDVVRSYGEARTFLRLTVERGHSLTGRTVVQGSEEPLPLVELVLTAHGRDLEPWQDAEAPAEERVYATSDERGNFRVQGLASGTWLLEARALGHARASLRSVRVPAPGPLTVTLQAAGVIEGFVLDARGGPAAGAEVQVSGRDSQGVSTGQGGGFSVEVEAGSYSLSARRGDEAGSLERPVIVSAGGTVRDVRVRLGAGSALEGRVVARGTGAPVEGASVDVSPYGSNGDSGRAVTDGTGHFAVRGLAPGSYDLMVSAPGFSSLMRRALTVSSGERFPLELQLAGTGAAEGQVRDRAGQPVQGAQVVGGSRWGDELGTTPAEARTDAEGRYRLEGLAAGPMSLTARREGSTVGVSHRVVVKEGGTTLMDFTLDETGTLEGVVRTPDGDVPSERLHVVAFAQSGRGAGDFGRAEVDTAGHFRMMLPPGSYHLEALSERISSFFMGTTKYVYVEAGKTVREELTWESKEHQGARLQGTVLEPDGTPSPGAFVTLSHDADSPGVFTVSADAQGRFDLALPEQGDAFTSPLWLHATSGGRTSESQELRGREREVVLRLRSSASVRGQVVRASGGAPVKGFTLSIHPQLRGDYMAESGPREFPGDRFELRDVPTRPVRLVARTADGAGGEALASPGSGATVEVTIAVNATAGVRGRVVDASTKEPVSGALAFIEGERLPDFDAATTDDGRFTVEGSKPGERSLIVMGGMGLSTVRRQVTLVEGQVLDVGDITLGPPRIPPGTIGVDFSQGNDVFVISQVLPASPAARAGVQPGDVLLAIDGARVTDAMDTRRRLRGAPGSTVVLTVRRAGAEQTLSVTRAP